MTPMNITQQPEGILDKLRTETLGETTRIYYQRRDDGHRFMVERTASGVDFWFDIRDEEPTEEE